MGHPSYASCWVRGGSRGVRQTTPLGLRLNGAPVHLLWTDRVRRIGDDRLSAGEGLRFSKNVWVADEIAAASFNMACAVYALGSAILERHSMQIVVASIILNFVFLLGLGAAVPHAFAQVNPRESVSSDDISVAEGLQLPTYGHVWALDTWKGLHELIRLKPPDTLGDDTGLSFKLHKVVEFKGEAAVVRVHDTAPLFFVRGVSGNESGRSDLVAVRLNIGGQKREVSKEAMAQLKQKGKNDAAPCPDVLSFKQERIGTTDWYRLTLQQSLSPGEYALIPLASSSGFAEGEIFDFAIDPEAPENANPLRSEQYRDPQ